MVTFFFLVTNMVIKHKVKVGFIIMGGSSQIKGILLQLVNNYDYEAIMAKQI